jgi:hypothetical protein
MLANTMNSESIEYLIKANTQGDRIAVKRILQALQIKVLIDPKLTDLCNISRADNNEAVIKLNATIDRKTKLTLICIAMAEFILAPERIQGTGISYDIFFIKDIYHQRFSLYMLLATRLAIPETVISAMSDPSFNLDAFAEKSDYLPVFIRSCVSDTSALFLLSNYYST